MGRRVSGYATRELDISHNDKCTSSLLPLSHLRVIIRVHKDAIRHGPFLNFSSYMQFCTYPRTSRKLIGNYISPEVYNVIRSFIYLFFHFASALTWLQQQSLNQKWRLRFNDFMYNLVSYNMPLHFLFYISLGKYVSLSDLQGHQRYMYFSYTLLSYNFIF